MGKKQNKLTIKKIVNYCPSCCRDNIPKTKTGSVVVARECPKHKPKFKRADNGVMVAKAFLDKFNEMHRRESLSSQKI